MLTLSQHAFSQHVYKATVYDSLDSIAMSGVNVIADDNNKTGALTNANGFVQINLSNADSAIINFRFIGYKSQSVKIFFPDTILHKIFLAPDEATLQQVTVISSTRSNDRIENATTKVEVLGKEEMNEESTLKPGNIASILGDVSGIQIQQSSVTSGNANVRIQGLEGKYTQILRDGMPLYEGYSGGFGILSIPPLDLKQIEIIKGPASTLYGGGAIAGLINLISKTPAYKPEASFLINQTTLKETNFNVYYEQRWKHIGFSFFGGQNFQKQVDVNKDGLSDLPNDKNTLIHPIIFIYPDNKSTVTLSWSGSFDNRKGGDMIAIDKPTPTHPYFEKNKLNRNTFLFTAEERFSNTIRATVKASYSVFNRDEVTNTYNFHGQQNNLYTEASAVMNASKHLIVAGANVTAYNFKPSATTPVPVGDFSNTTYGLFLQDTWQLLQSTKLEAGLRFDNTDNGNFLLPRLALFHHINEHWGTRLGFGMGYLTPDPLTPQLKDYSIYNILQLPSAIKAERSIGGNAELNYKKDFGEGKSFFINTAFFITSISHPVIANEQTNGDVLFSNESKPVITKGIDTYMQAAVNNWEFYAGYTYTNAERKYLSQQQFMIYTPANRAAFVISYAVENKWRCGIEGSYTGKQYRDDYTKTPGYMFMAAMIEKDFTARWSIILNCENLLDERQSKYESLYTGDMTDPQFKTLWAPIDGRVANLSLRFRPFEK